MPVYKLLDEMPHEEMLGWFDYFERRPVGWRADLRAAYVMQSQGAKIKPSEVLPSLKAVSSASSSSAAESLKKSSLFSRMLSAVGGDKPEFLK